MVKQLGLIIVLCSGCSSSTQTPAGDGAGSSSNETIVMAMDPATIRNDRIITLEQFGNHRLFSDDGTLLGFDLTSAELSDDDLVRLVSGFRDEVEILRIDASDLGYSLAVLRNLKNLKSLTAYSLPDIFHLKGEQHLTSALMDEMRKKGVTIGSFASQEVLPHEKRNRDN